MDSLEKMNGSYVTDDLRGRHGDAVWRVRWGEDWLSSIFYWSFNPRWIAS